MRSIFTVVALSLAGYATAGDLYGMNQNGLFYKINDADGTTVLLQNLQRTSVKGLAYNTVDQSFYFVDGPALYAFKPGGQPGLKRNLGFVSGIMEDIAIDRSGVVWGLEAGSPDKLWRFGTVSGESLVKAYDVPVTLNLDFGSDGSLYCWRNSVDPTASGMYVVDRHDGSLTKISNENSGSGKAIAIPSTSAYNCSVLEFSGGDLFQYDLSTGGTTNHVAPTAQFCRGAAYDTPKPFTATTTLGAINFGRLDQNPAGCLEDRDGTVLRVCKFIVPNQSAAPIQFELKANGPSGQTLFGVFFKGRTTASGSLTCSIEGKRLSDGGFDMLDQRKIDAAGRTFFRNFGAAAPYFDANGDGVLRVAVRTAGPVSSVGFCLELDQFAVGMD